MTKEEILKKALLDNGGYDPNEFIADYTKTYSVILLAMDEYAKNIAIAFSEWAAEAGWEKHIGENTWFNRMGYATEYTTEQLHTLFNEHIKQQSAKL